MWECGFLTSNPTFAPIRVLLVAGIFFESQIFCYSFNSYLQCKSLNLPKCKRMTEAMINNAKKCLKNLTKCDEIYTSEDPMGDFGKAILNYYQHYTDDHSSTWCRFHKKVLIKQCLDRFG